MNPTFATGASAPTGLDLWFCTLVGIGVTAGLFVITDYYTSTRFRPVRTTAAYQLVALPTEPPKPGLVRIGPGGASIEAELVRKSLQGSRRSE